MKNKAFFLDRDWTINCLNDKPYVFSPNDVKLCPNVKDTLLKLKELGYLLVIITNQTWVGAWFYTKEDAIAVNKKIEELLWFKFDWIYSCYHHPNAGCNCRKPNIWNILQASKDLNIDISRSYLVWDKEKDVLAGIKAGCKLNFLISSDDKFNLWNIVTISNFSDILKYIN